MKKNRVTWNQMMILKLQLGYHSEDIPTVDEAIDYLRRKYHVCIYDYADPFVSSETKTIQYSYGVKYCDVNAGWNYRIYIGSSNWSNNSYSAKRKAITIAIRWIMKNKDRFKRKRKTVKLKND